MKKYDQIIIGAGSGLNIIPDKIDKKIAIIEKIKWEEPV